MDHTVSITIHYDSTVPAKTKAKIDGERRGALLAEVRAMTPDQLAAELAAG